MTSSRLLYELQELDWEIEHAQATLTSLQERLKDDAAVRTARTQVAERETRIRDLRVQQRRHDGEVREFQEKVQGLERKLYGGSVTNPRELQSMQEEFRLVKAHATEAEEALLEVMVSLDDEEASAVRGRTDLADLEQAWSRTQATLTAESQSLAQSLGALQTRRDGLVSRVPPLELGLYSQLRTARQGQAVAKVERGMCQGCRLTLPSKELQAIRIAREPVQCSSCGRILYLG